MKKINFIWIIALFLLNLPLINAGPVNATDSRYDLTNLTTQDDLYGFVVEVNKLTDSIFMSGILLVSFVPIVVPHDSNQNHTRGSVNARELEPQSSADDDQRYDIMHLDNHRSNPNARWLGDISSRYFSFFLRSSS